MIETELRRAFRSRGMLVVVLVAVILAAGNLYSSLQMDRHFAEIRKMMLEQHDVTYYPYIAFEKYIGDNMFLPYNGIYFILFCSRSSPCCRLEQAWYVMSSCIIPEIFW